MKREISVLTVVGECGTTRYDSDRDPSSIAGGGAVTTTSGRLVPRPLAVQLMPFPGLLFLSLRL